MQSYSLSRPLALSIFLFACGDGSAGKTAMPSDAEPPAVDAGGAVEMPPGSALDASADLVDAVAEVDAEVDATGGDATTSDAQDGAQVAPCSAEHETRVRFASAAVPAGESCLPEEQQRTCQDGVWSGWSGSFAAAQCEVSSRPCDNASHGAQEQRVAYRASWVSAGEVCVSQTQQRRCENGVWSAWDGTFEATWCVVCSTPLDACGACGGPGPSVMFADADGDGFGDPQHRVDVCPGNSTAGLVTDSTDTTPDCFTLRGTYGLSQLSVLGKACEIVGDLLVDTSASAAEISLPLLQRVTGQLRVEAISNLATTALRMEQLRALGSLVILRSALQSLRLPNLQEIAGDATFGICGSLGCEGSKQLATVDFSALSHIRGALSVSVAHPQLAAFMPSLERVGSLFWRHEAPSRLSGTQLPKLATIDLALEVSAINLTQVSLPELVSVPSALFAGAQLTTLQLSKLHTIGKLEINATGLTTFDCATVVPVLAAQRLEELSVADNSALTSFVCNQLKSAGVLSFLRSSVESIQLDALTRVAELSIRSTPLTELRLGQLVTVDERLSLDSGPLTQLTLPALATAKDLSFSLSVRGALSLPSLRQVTNLVIVGGIGLGPSAVELPALEAVAGDLIFQVLRETQALEAPELKRVGGNLQLELGEPLHTLDLSALERVGSAFSITFAYRLTSLSMPALAWVGGDFSLTWMGALSQLSVPALTHAQTLSFRVNSSYPQCEIDKLALRVGAACVACSENGSGVCAP